jgi:endonuclease YncB( thermonuclease family)
MKRTLCLLLLLALVLGCSKPTRTKKTAPPASTKPPPRSVEAPKPAVKPAPPSSRHDEKKLSLRVVNIADGDTLTGIDSQKSQTKIRFFGIDAPESDQAFGQASKKALSEKVFGKDITVVIEDVDRYGRTVGRVFYGDRDINLAMVQEGFAWHYKKYSNDPRLAEAEKKARESKKGLWKDSDPIPPWDWRKTEKERKKK